MGTIDFFSNTPRMRGYRGDTFPEFCIRTDALSLTGCSMRFILERKDIPRSCEFTKACVMYTFEDGGKGFVVQLSSTDTAKLCGTYTMHFIMMDANGREYRKLVGTLEVLDIPKEV